MRILFLALVFVTRLAGAEFYQSQLLETRWSLQSGKLFCRLSQEIPHLGYAVMEQEAGQPLRFVLRLETEGQVDMASVRIDPAPWQHHVLPGRSYPVAMSSINANRPQQLIVEGEIAEKMLAALYAGHFPSFTLHRSWQGGMSEARVGISSVRFWERYDAFRVCRMKLPSFGLKDFEGLRFYFEEEQSRLPSELIRVLPNISRYLKLAGKGQVVVRNAAEGLVTEKGKVWFHKRFTLIKNRLHELGLGEKQISIRPSSRGPSIEMTLFGPEGLCSYHYDRNQTVLSHPQKRRLALLARYVREYFPGQLVIHGHSDGARWRSEKANRALAKLWAQEVRDFLLGKGVSAERMSIRVWGSRRRAATNLSRQGQARNRRVVIELLDKPRLTAARD